MQLGASQANQGTPPFWRGRLEEPRRGLFQTQCFFTADVYNVRIEKDEAERSNGEA